MDIQNDNGELINKGIRIFEKNNESLLEGYRNRLENGDIQTNIIHLIDELHAKTKDKSDPNYNFYGQLHLWVIFRFCVKDNFKLMRGWLDHRINTGKDIRLLTNASNSQVTLNEFLVDNGNLKIEELQSIFLDAERNDLIIGKFKKSTKLFKNSIKKLKNNNKGLKTNPTKGLEQASIPEKEQSKNEKVTSELEKIKSSENQFLKGISMEKVIEHFEVLTKKRSRNGNVFLTSEQFISYLKRGFLNDKTQPKQKINYSNTEKGFVILRFYEFYDLAVSQYKYPAKTAKFIELIVDCFDNWDKKTIISFFKSGKTKSKW